MANYQLYSYWEIVITAYTKHIPTYCKLQIDTEMVDVLEIGESK